MFLKTSDGFHFFGWTARDHKLILNGKLCWSASSFTPQMLAFHRVRKTPKASPPTSWCISEYELISLDQVDTVACVTARASRLFHSQDKSCNHNGLGIYYLLSGFIFGISGTLISVLLRIELYSSGNRIISPEIEWSEMMGSLSLCPSSWSCHCPFGYKLIPERNSSSSSFSCPSNESRMRWKDEDG